MTITFSIPTWLMWLGGGAIAIFVIALAAFGLFMLWHMKDWRM